MVMPGDNVTITVKLIVPVAMDKGLRFAIRGLAEQDRRHPGWKPGKDVVTAEEMREKASSQYNRDGTTIHLDLIDHA